MPLDGKLDETTEILIQARDFIAQGWCQKKTEDESGAVCAIGAIMKTCCSAHMYIEVRRRLEGVLGLENGQQLIYWNNEPGRTQADVLAVYDAAIAS